MDLIARVQGTALGPTSLPPIATQTRLVEDAFRTRQLLRLPPTAAETCDLTSGDALSWVGPGLVLREVQFAREVA